MNEILSKSLCTGCSACYSICPQNAISMQEDDNGFKHPIIKQSMCINCGLCKKTCPVLNTIMKEKQVYAYACYNKNDEDRLQSSSGGIFILLAFEIIKRGGVVFGASFDEKFDVIHTFIENENDICKFMGSKYVQSNIENSYKQVKEFLNNGRYVLFTGTPCQIEGLKSFLGKEYEKLYTQDLICHGVPSPKVWNKYKEYRKSLDKSEPLSISFRNKDNGWKGFSMKFVYNGYSYKSSLKDDSYMKAFLKNISLRDSCYNCKFKKKYRESDITLADFWGINNLLPKFDIDDKGISLAIINSKKGKELFASIGEKIVYKETNFEESIKYNSAYIKSVSPNKNRSLFFKNMDDFLFDKLIKKYIRDTPLLKKVIRWVLSYVKNNNIQ